MRKDAVEPDELHVFDDPACGGFHYLEANVADAPGECSSGEN